MSKVKTINHKGLNIIYTDLSNLDVSQAKQGLEEALGVVGKQPPKSVYSLVNFTGTRFSRDVVELLRYVSKTNEPYIVATGIVGLTSMTKLMAKSAILYGRRNAKVVDELDEAKDWLVAESKKVN